MVDITKKLVGKIKHSCKDCILDDDDDACIAADCTNNEGYAAYVFINTDNLTPEDIEQ